MASQSSCLYMEPFKFLKNLNAKASFEHPSQNKLKGHLVLQVAVVPLASGFQNNKFGFLT